MIASANMWLAEQWRLCQTGRIIGLNDIDLLHWSMLICNLWSKDPSMPMRDQVGKIGLWQLQSTILLALIEQNHSGICCLNRVLQLIKVIYLGNWVWTALRTITSHPFVSWAQLKQKMSPDHHNQPLMLSIGKNFRNVETLYGELWLPQALSSVCYDSQKSYQNGFNGEVTLQ